MKKQDYFNRAIILAATLSLVALAGCKQDPFPETSKGKIVESQKQPTEVALPYSFEMASTLNCKEGEACSMTLRGHVPGNDPVLTFDNLPEGATYNAVEGKLSYTPSYDVVDLKKNPKAVIEQTTVRITLRSKSDAISARSTELTINVTNVLRTMDVVPASAMTGLVEGQVGEQIVDIKSEDLPSGPFNTMLVGSPVGMTVAPTATVGQYKISFTPARNFVTLADATESGRRVKILKFKMVVSVPSGQQTEKEITWKILDDRLAPAIVAPLIVTQGPIISFTVRADDLNGERVPTIKGLPIAPFGRLNIAATETSPLTPGAYPYVIYTVIWDQLTSDRIGQTVPMKFEFCSDKVCAAHEVKVTVTGNEHKAPLVDRGAWPLSKLGAVRVGETLTVPLAIKDAEDPKFGVRVKILPASMEPFVKWEAGSLKITPTAAGLQHFTVSATSVYEVSTFEAFLFDAMPKDWASFVVLTGYGPSKEATAMHSAAGQGEVLSSAYQLTEQTSRLRKAVFVTTDALSTPEGVKNLANAASEIRTVIVSSPALGKSSQLVSELKSLGVTLSSRVAEDPKSFGIVLNAASGLDAPAKTAGLQGTLTSESVSPLSFEIVPASVACVPLMSLQARTSYLVGVSCARAGGGRLIVLGFELADTDLDPATMSKWFGTWIKGAL